jgi:hypothetical protein
MINGHFNHLIQLTVLLQNEARNVYYRQNFTSNIYWLIYFKFTCVLSFIKLLCPFRYIMMIPHHKMNHGIAQLRSANASSGTVSTGGHSSTDLIDIQPVTSIAGRAECRSCSTIIATLHEDIISQESVTAFASNSESTSHFEQIVIETQIASGHSTHKSLAGEAVHAEFPVSKSSLKEITEPKQ